MMFKLRIRANPDKKIKIYNAYIIFQNNLIVKIYFTTFTSTQIHSKYFVCVFAVHKYLFLLALTFLSYCKFGKNILTDYQKKYII